MVVITIKLVAVSIAIIVAELVINLVIRIVITVIIDFQKNYVQQIFFVVATTMMFIVRIIIIIVLIYQAKTVSQKTPQITLKMWQEMNQNCCLCYRNSIFSLNQLVLVCLPFNFLHLFPFHSAFLHLQLLFNQQLNSD